jgi:hypothetical protein
LRNVFFRDSKSNQTNRQDTSNNGYIYFKTKEYTRGHDTNRRRHLDRFTVPSAELALAARAKTVEFPTGNDGRVQLAARRSCGVRGQRVAASDSEWLERFVRLPSAKFERLPASKREYSHPRIFFFFFFFFFFFVKVFFLDWCAFPLSRFPQDSSVSDSSLDPQIPGRVVDTVVSDNLPRFAG